MQIRSHANLEMCKPTHTAMNQSAATLRCRDISSTINIMALRFVQTAFRCPSSATQTHKYSCNKNTRWRTWVCYDIAVVITCSSTLHYDIVFVQIGRLGATGGKTTSYHVKENGDPNSDFDLKTEESEPQYLIKWIGKQSSMCYYTFCNAFSHVIEHAIHHSLMLLHMIITQGSSKEVNVLGEDYIW